MVLSGFKNSKVFEYLSKSNYVCFGMYVNSDSVNKGNLNYGSRTSVC